jgi:queuosine precursor transporter
MPRVTSLDADDRRLLGSPWFLLITGLFVMALVLSNVIAVKLVEVSGRVFDAGTLLFPLTYLIGDVLTEVYGYRRSRLVIWVGFAASLVSIGAIQIAIVLPPAGFWEENQAAYETVLDSTWRIFLASLTAYLVGEFSNAYILAKLKIATRGRWLWLRTSSSTIVGEGLDSTIFSTIAFAGTGVPLGNQIVTIWVIKVAWEIAATPLTYLVCGSLKKREGIDVYDVGTDFNPFAVTSRSR